MTADKMYWYVLVLSIIQFLTRLALSVKIGYWFFKWIKEDYFDLFKISFCFCFFMSNLYFFVMKIMRFTSEYDTANYIFILFGQQWVVLFSFWSISIAYPALLLWYIKDLSLIQKNIDLEIIRKKIKYHEYTVFFITWCIILFYISINLVIWINVVVQKWMYIDNEGKLIQNWDSNCSMIYILYKMINYLAIITFLVYSIATLFVFKWLISTMKSKLNYFYKMHIKSIKNLIIMNSIFWGSTMLKLIIANAAKNTPYIIIFAVPSKNHIEIVTYVLYFISEAIQDFSLWVFVYYWVQNLKFKLYVQAMLYGYSIYNTLPKISIFIVKSWYEGRHDSDLSIDNDDNKQYPATNLGNSEDNHDQLLNLLEEDIDRSQDSNDLYKSAYLHLHSTQSLKNTTSKISVKNS